MALKLARYATGRHKTLSMWDAFHGANLDAISVGGEALFRRGARPDDAGHRACAAAASGARFFGDDQPFERLADYIDYVLEVQGDVAALIAEPMRWTTVEPPPPGFWPRVRDELRSARRAADLRRDPELPRPHRHHVRLRAGRRHARHPRCIGKGLGGGIMPMAAIMRRADLDLRARGSARPLHAREESGRLRRRARHARRDRRGRAARPRRATSARRPRTAATIAGRHPLISEVRGARSAISASRSAARRGRGQRAADRLLVSLPGARASASSSAAATWSRSARR